jgi:hypothetical protein
MDWSLGADIFDDHNMIILTDNGTWDCPLDNLTKNTRCTWHKNPAYAFNFGAEGRTRTDTISLPRDFESRASTNFATSAFVQTCQLYANKKLKEVKKKPTHHYSSSLINL